MPEVVAIVTANQVPSPTIKTEPAISELASIIMSGIQVAVGIGPSTFTIGFIQYLTFSL